MKNLKLPHLRYLAPSAVGLAILLATIRGLSASEMRESSPGHYQGYTHAAYSGMKSSSFYLPMRDGVRLAVDLYLPTGLKPGEKLPAILEQTRYGRRLDFRAPFSWFLQNSPRYAELFVTHGYAYLKIDVRGSGASFGNVAYPWSIDEIKDGGEIVDWIVRQSWSDGNVGSTGLSYMGEASEFLLVNRHPAVKAIAPWSAFWDAYCDVSFPGGAYLSWFVPTWSGLGMKLDRNDFSGPPFQWYVPIAVRGFKPVDGDSNGALFKAAIASHHTIDLTTGTSGEGFRDDQPAVTNQLARGLSSSVIDQVQSTFKTGLGGIALVNPRVHKDEVEASGAAVYSIDGWFDGAYVRGAIERYLSLRNPHKLIVGPWIHGLPRNVSTGEKFDLGWELLRFFDFELKAIPDGVMNEAPVSYYTMGEEKWKTAAQWPLANQASVAYYLSADHLLSTERPSDSHRQDAYGVDNSAGTGRRSRWEPLMGDETAGGSSVLDYGDRAEADKKLLVYDTKPLNADTEVTGHPIARLFVNSTSPDGEFFAYLEDVSPAGQVSYVTEGELRAIHRKVTSDNSRFCSIVPCHSFLKKDGAPMRPGEIAELDFDLLPTSYLFKKGHSIRIALAGADKDHFATMPGPAPSWHVERNAKYASLIDLPVIPR
jgi:putative CocE/NonD family hydrolase